MKSATYRKKTGQPRNVSIGGRIDEALEAWVVKRCANSGVSRSQLVEIALVHYRRSCIDSRITGTHARAIARDARPGDES